MQLYGALLTTMAFFLAINTSSVLGEERTMLRSVQECPDLTIKCVIQMTPALVTRVSLSSRKNAKMDWLH